MTVPIVDFGQFLKGDKTAKASASQAIDKAFRDYGFVYLKNHGVSKSQVGECFEWVSISHIISQLY
jgi:isopenicillin N synthase-like dioxygenase